MGVADFVGVVGVTAPESCVAAIALDVVGAVVVCDAAVTLAGGGSAVAADADPDAETLAMRGAKTTK